MVLVYCVFLNITDWCRGHQQATRSGIRGSYWSHRFIVWCRIRRAKTWWCCVASLFSSSTFPIHSFQMEAPSLSPLSSGALDCTSSFSFLMFWCVFLKGLCIWEKKNLIYFNLYLIFIFYNELPETGVFSFCFILHPIPNFGRANVKYVHLNVGGEKRILSHSAFFMWRVCKEKKRCKRRSWRDWDVFTTRFTLRKVLLHQCQIAWGCAWACTPQFI